MDSDRYTEVKKLFLESRSLSSTARRGFLAELRKQAPELADQVEILLLHDTELRTAAGRRGRAGPAPGGGEPAAGAGGDEDRFGPYILHRELGRGGQGIVYLAEDTRLHRQVALKVLTGLGPVTKETMCRFQREAEAASRA